MKQLNYNYSSKKEFLDFLQQHHVNLFDDKILVQMFTSVEDKKEIQTIVTDVCAILPNAKLIGASTAGEILESHMLEKQVVLSISIFEKTTLETIYIDEKNFYRLGEKVAKKLLKDDVKCVISFVEGLSQLGEEYLDGFNAHNKNNIIIAGGMAGDLFTFSNTFVIHQNKIYTSGVVAVGLYGDALEVTNDYNLGWKAVGPEFMITKAEGNRVYEINNKPVKLFYSEILGQEVAQNMPASTIEFPLLKQENGVVIARSVINPLKDGSIIYAGKFKKGDKVHFGLGSANAVNHYNPTETSYLANKKFQAALVYSCSARKQFLSFELEKTFAQISGLAPTAGFFTYGEFYTKAQHPMMLNITNTFLFLNEKGTKHEKKKPAIKTESTHKNRLTESATLHLIDYVSHNLQQQQKELDKTKFKLNEFFKAIDSVVIISRTDLQGKITYANKEFEKISGYTKKELLGKNHNIIRNPLTDAEVFKNMWQTITKGNIWHGTLSNRAKDGSIYYAKSHIFPIFDQEHNITEYMAIRKDITDVVISQKAYENQLNFSNMLFDNEEDIIVVTKNNKVDKMNQAFYRTFAYADLESFISWHECICDLFIEKDGYLRKEKKPKMWYNPILKEPHKLHFALILDANHQERIYSVKSREVIYDDKTVYVIHTFNDITELEEAKQKAQRAEIAQAMFLANMSHEIRTPMNGILGFTELLQNSELSDTQKKYVDIVNNSTKTLLSIINDILDSSKIANNKIDLENIEINPYIEFMTTYELLKSLTKQKSLIYTNNFDINMSECIISDPTRLRQILTNLLSNAIKFTPKNGKVLLQTEIIKTNENSQTIRFSISDTGIGIPKEKLQTIFKPFSQADDSTTRKFGGTGLGLTISADLVKLFGGTLEVISEEGKGTTFFFDLEFKKCVNTSSLSKLLAGYELLIIGDENHLVIQKIDETLASFHVHYKHIEKEDDFINRLSENSIILTLDTKKGMQARTVLPREQIICITDTCNNEELDCVDLSFDESFSSNLYNFLLTKMQNYTLEHEEEKQLLTQTIKILVAEDYDINRMLIESLFEKHPNIAYEFAYDGEEAVEKATTAHYDMILMDVNMPNMNGLDATKIIREKLTYHIPIIALTANAIKGDKERFLQAGMDDYMSKPIKVTKFNEMILKYAPSKNNTEEEKDRKQEKGREQNKEYDFTKLLQKNKTNLGLDEAVVIKLLNAFTQSTQQSLKELKEAFQAKNEEKILNIAHKIKGASATLSLNKISTLMEEIENNIHNNIEIRYNDILQTIDNSIALLERDLKNAK